MLGINKTRTTPYHPQSDWTSVYMLATAGTEYPGKNISDHSAWPITPCSVHSITGHTPFFLMFGRQARMPIDVAYGPPPSTTASSPSEFATQLRQRQKAYERAREKLGRLHHQKDLYDRKVHGDPYAPGDLV